MRKLTCAALALACAPLACCVNGQAAFDTSTLSGAVTVGADICKALCPTKQDKKIAKDVEKGVNDLPQ
jgi:hypothetical protein